MFSRTTAIPALLALTVAVPLRAQRLADRVAAVREGTVTFTYASRPEVCGDGRSIIVRQLGTEGVTIYSPEDEFVGLVERAWADVHPRTGAAPLAAEWPGRGAATVGGMDGGCRRRERPRCRRGATGGGLPARARRDRFGRGVLQRHVCRGHRRQRDCFSHAARDRA
jgi:hypothetical protein